MDSSSKASRRLAEAGIVWEANFKTLWANPSFQAAGSSTDSPATACPDSQKVPELPGQRSDANEQLPCRHLGNTTQGKTTQGRARAATDGCQGMRQHQASTQEHFPQVLYRNTSPKCSPNLRLFLSQWISQAKHCFCHSSAFSETLPITHLVSS